VCSVGYIWGTTSLGFPELTAFCCECEWVCECEIEMNLKPPWNVCKFKTVLVPNPFCKMPVTQTRACRRTAYWGNVSEICLCPRRICFMREMTIWRNLDVFCSARLSWRNRLSSKTRVLLVLFHWTTPLLEFIFFSDIWCQRNRILSSDFFLLGANTMFLGKRLELSAAGSWIESCGSLNYYTNHCTYIKFIH